MNRKYFTFTVMVGGYGETAEEAWADAVEHFDIACEEQPINYDEEEEEV